MKILLAILFLFYFCTAVPAQNKACLYNAETMQFSGSSVEQARCLLRPNKIGGVLGEQLKKLPNPLEKLIGQNTGVDKKKLLKYLGQYEKYELLAGGSIDDALSTGTLPSGAKVPALYFVIHDTSSPYLGDAPFPSVIDYSSYEGNILDNWLKQPVAHVFINRNGRSLTVVPFSETVTKGWGTKFSRDFHKAEGKGLQLHIELVQPRRRDPAGTEKNDRIAPTPGFTDKQYERLALLYICASVRRGTWLIPAYHSAIDAGIKDAHDDPQNFVLETFAGKVSMLIKAFK